MRSFPVLVILVFAISFCKLTDRFTGNRGSQNTGESTANSNKAPAYGSRFKGSIKDLLPQRAGDFKLEVPINPRAMGIGVPVDTEALGGLYRAPKGTVVKHLLVNFPTIEESAKTFRAYANQFHKQGKEASTEEVRDGQNVQLGQRLLLFDEGEQNILWTNGSLFALVKSSSKGDASDFARQLPYYAAIMKD